MSSYGSRMEGLASGHKPCPCGWKAIKFKCGGFACKECDEIEIKMNFDSRAEDKDTRKKEADRNQNKRQPQKA